MEMIPFIEHLLYEVSTALYLPVIGGCALLMCYIPLQQRHALFEGMQRWRGVCPGRQRFVASLADLGKQYAVTPGHLPIEVERLQAAELELSAARSMRFVIKVGPALGLMGTLIPMGISLAALAEGNIRDGRQRGDRLRYLVAGLGSGVLAYLIALSRERWARGCARNGACRRTAAHRLEPAAVSPYHLQEEAEHALAGVDASRWTAEHSKTRLPGWPICSMPVSFSSSMMIALFMAYNMMDLLDPSSEVTMVKRYQR